METCERCKKHILNPLDHEFCIYSPQLKINLPKPIASPEADNYIPPLKQPKIRHSYAPKKAHLPWQFNKSSEETEDGYQALSRKLREDF